MRVYEGQTLVIPVIYYFMPRQPRQFEVGGVYHVMNRGYDKRKVYLDDADYLRFAKSLYYFNDENIVDFRKKKDNEGQALVVDERRPVVEILAFVLMPNHYHLILREIREGGVSSFMQKLGTAYTGYFNEKYKRKGVGGIFQSRYKTVHVQDNQQLSTVFVYVHANPIELRESSWKDLKTKNARNALSWIESYRWSSYHDYVSDTEFPKTIQSDFFLDFYGDKKKCRQAVYDWVTFKAKNAQLGPEIIE